MYVLIYKDFSLSFNLQNPDDEVQPQQNLKKGQSDKKKKKDIYTDLIAKKEKKVDKSSIWNRFSSPFIGKEKKNTQEGELAKIDSEIKMAYIDRFAHVAQSEQEKFGIPASVILANAMVHSLAGQRKMTVWGNNHFALPCTSDWSGENKSYDGTCYRAYESAWTSYRDHSFFLRNGPFRSLRNLQSKDVGQWAKLIEKSGYSDLNNVSDLIQETIREYSLEQFD